MNRDSLPNEILYLPPIARIHLSGDEYVKYSAVLDKVYNAYELQKPEIPHWLAERIEEYNIDSSAGFWRFVFNGSIFDPEERAWILDNDDIINKIFLCGYTVKEPVWVVKINKKLYFCRFIDKYFEENSDEPTYSESGNPELVKKFTDKAKAEAVATLVKGEVEEWSE